MAAAKGRTTVWQRRRYARAMGRHPTESEDRVLIGADRRRN